MSRTRPAALNEFQRRTALLRSDHELVEWIRGAVDRNRYPDGRPGAGWEPLASALDRFDTAGGHAVLAAYVWTAPPYVTGVTELRRAAGGSGAVRTTGSAGRVPPGGTGRPEPPEADRNGPEK